VARAGLPAFLFRFKLVLKMLHDVVIILNPCFDMHNHFVFTRRFWRR